MIRKKSDNGHKTRYVIKDNDLIAAHFPPPDVNLLSPAFIAPETISQGFSNGTAGPTDEDTMNDFLSSIADHNHWAVYNACDFKSEDDRNIPYLLLSASSLTQGDSPERLRIWIQGATHGDEPASEQAVLAFLGKLDSDEVWATSLLERLEILIIPRYNPDGAAHASRRFTSDLDPARDNVEQISSQTRDIKSLYNSFTPHVSVDMHEFGARYQYAAQYVQAADAQFAVAKNLNIHAGIRHLSETLFAESIGSALSAANLRWQTYAVGNSYASRKTPLKFVEANGDAKITRNAWGLTQSIGILCETRGIGIADQHFARRTFAGLTMLESIVQTTWTHADDIHHTLSTARLAFTESRADIIVTDSQTSTTCNTRPFIDITTGHLVHLRTLYSSSSPLVPILTRARPLAYIFPPPLKSLNSSVIEAVFSKLCSLGVHLRTALQPFRCNVRVLKYASVTVDESGKTHRQTVVTEQTNAIELREVQAGSVIVDTRQRNAALAFVALEPENVDSFVSCGLVRVEAGMEDLAWRVMEGNAWLDAMTD